MNAQLKRSLFFIFLITCPPLYAKTLILAQAGDVKIIQTNCNDETYECDYIKTYQNKTEELIRKWSKTAVAYQFSPDLIGFKVGASNIPHLLTTYDAKNNKKEFFEALMVDQKNKCFITHEEVNKDQYEVKFYRLPNLKPYFTLNNKIKGLEDFTRLATHYRDEEDGSFNFNYGLVEEGESYYKDIKVMNPCSDRPRIIVD